MLCVLRHLSVYLLAFALSTGMAFSQTGTTLHNFQGAPTDGQFPTDRLITDKSGNLYGTTQYGGNGLCNSSGVPGCGTVFRLSPPIGGSKKWTETILYHFQGRNSGLDGSTPTGGLILDRNGNLYGTTMFGGTSGAGTVFELKPPTSASGAWSEVILYNFQGSPNDVAVPASSLIFDAGNLYGTTVINDVPGLNKCGAVFELQRPAKPGRAWTESIIHSFTGDQKSGVDGCYTASGVIRDSYGNLFGTTDFGGLGNNAGTSLGVVYELTSSSSGSWSESFPFNFNGGSPGGGSGAAGLIFDSAGNLYGTTSLGGANTCSKEGDACGMVFQLSPQGNGTWTETTLYNFQSANNSYWPVGSLIIDSAGNLYGVTLNSVYKLAPPSVSGNPWTETVLFNFPGGTAGTNPAAGLLYYRGTVVGTTSSGGTGPCSSTSAAAGCGMVYRVTLH